MAQQKIYLRKVRDFGENIGDTFQFIRQEFKPLLKSFFLISGIFMLAAAILTGIYQMEFTSVFDKMDPSDKFPTDTFLSLFSGGYFLAILLIIIGIIAMNVCVAAYMKLYDGEGVSPSIEDVWAEFKRYFFRAAWLTIVITIITVIAIAICVIPIALMVSLISPLMILPGLVFLLPLLYVFVLFTPAIMIMINEDASLGDTLTRCYALLKQNFWLSLGIYLVAYFIYSFASGIIGLVFGIFAGIGSYVTTKEVDSSVAVVSSVTNIFSYTFYIIFGISVGLNYYNLSEQKDGVGMMRRLDTLGSANPNNTTEEQY